VDGVDLHAIALSLAHGQDPQTLPRAQPTADAAASFVYRFFDPAHMPPMPNARQRQALHQAFPDGLLLEFPKSKGSTERDYKWLGSYRYGILHLGGADAADLRQRCEQASTLLGWTAPYADLHPESLAPVAELQPTGICLTSNAEPLADHGAPSLPSFKESS
jgi:hypothetical protein